MPTIYGPTCAFCGTVMGMNIPDRFVGQISSEQAETLLDKYFSVHLLRHVNDFLYGEGGVFADGPVDRPGGGLRPPDPPA